MGYADCDFQGPYPALQLRHPQHASDARRGRCATGCGGTCRGSLGVFTVANRPSLVDAMEEVGCASPDFASGSPSTHASSVIVSHHSATISSLARARATYTLVDSGHGLTVTPNDMGTLVASGVSL